MAHGQKFIQFICTFQFLGVGLLMRKSTTIPMKL